MKIGNLRYKIAIYRKTSTQNSTGELIARWEQIATPFASISHKASREVLKSEVLAENQVIFRIRHDVKNPINQGDLVKFDGKTYGITGTRLELDLGFCDLITTQGTMSEENNFI